MKTRLVADSGISPKAVSELYSAILKDIFNLLTDIVGSRRSQLYISYAPLGFDAEVQSLFGNGIEISYFPQVGQNVGERIVYAFDRAFKDGNSSAILIFGDQPGLSKSLILSACEVIDSKAGRNEQHIVLGPTHDGGTYLIGLRVRR